MEVVAGRRSGHCRAVRIVPDPEAEEVAAWAASGAMALTGRRRWTRARTAFGARREAPNPRRAARGGGTRARRRRWPWIRWPCSPSGLRSRGCGAVARRAAAARPACFPAATAGSCCHSHDPRTSPSSRPGSSSRMSPPTRGITSRRRSRRDRVTSSSSGLVCSVCPPPGCRRRPEEHPGCRSRPSSAPRTRSPTSPTCGSWSWRPCGRGRCAAHCSRPPGPTWSRWSRPAGPTALGAVHRRSSTSSTAASAASRST